ncbi:MAG TPA: chitobiase/beta-hexosaminidase C-terminal domain-containing protein [Sumerlaeia bacterium]|nr:chitobiase/beta-hexosaminidase C-terminal domain-containing protein [Sumerlaeia bacterium]
MGNPVGTTLQSAVCLAIVCVATAVAADVSVVPRPKKIATGEGVVALPVKFAIVISPGATDTERYAAETLRKDLRTCFDVRTTIQERTKTQEPGIYIGTAVSFPAAHKELGGKARAASDGLPSREGYVIALAGSRREPKVLVVGASRVGAMYGCFTLTQLFSKSGERLELPADLYIEDWPVMETRAQVDAPGDLSPEGVARLDHLARWRINAIYYQHFYPYMAVYENGERKTIEWTHHVRPDLKDIVREAHVRGITVYGCIGARWAPYEWYLGEPLTFKNPKHLETILPIFDEMAQAGVDGLMFLFDDIQENVGPEDLGREHVEWMRGIKRIAQKYGLERVMMCPTHYWKGWKPAYYKPFGEADDLADMRMYFCPFDTEEVRRVKEAGLRNYEWWQNGVYPFSNPYGLWGGINRVEWGWYGGDSPEVLREIRTLPERTRHAWLCNGGDVVIPVWGHYLWDPAAYQPAEMERAVAEVLFGRGAAAPHLSVVEHIRGWSRMLGTADGTGAEFEASTERARERLALLKPILLQAERPGMLPMESRLDYWQRLEKDLDTLLEKAYVPFTALDPGKHEDSVELKIVSRRSGVALRYTLDGTEPTLESPLYTGPLQLTRSATIRAKAFLDGKEKGEARATLHKHDANGRKVAYAKPYSEKYPGGGSGGLTDGIRASTDHGDRAWQGFEKDDLDATIDLGRAVKIREIRVGFLQNVAPWIFLPTEVEFAVSTNRNRFDSVKRLPNKVPNTKSGAFIEDFVAEFGGQSARYVRVRAKNIGVCPPGHGHAGEKAWLFVDEILVNSDEDDRER